MTFLSKHTRIYLRMNSYSSQGKKQTSVTKSDESQKGSGRPLAGLTPNTCPFIFIHMVAEMGSFDGSVEPSSEFHVLSLTKELQWLILHKSFTWYTLYNNSLFIVDLKILLYRPLYYLVFKRNYSFFLHVCKSVSGVLPACMQISIWSRAKDSHQHEHVFVTWDCY